MSRTFTKKEMCFLLGCSERTIDYDVECLNIKPSQGDRGTNLYSQSDFSLIKSLREHCLIPGNGRSSFVPAAEIEIVSEAAVVKKVKDPYKSDKIKRDYTTSLNAGLSADPLYDLEILQRISDNRWLLPTNRLAPILGLSPAYLSSLSRHEYCGFIITKEVYSKGRALWAIAANNS